MPLDAVCLRAVVEELRPQLTGLRIDKVQQPSRDQVILLLRAGKLLLSAGAGAPRLQLTELPRDNPAQPPMFCMLLRKHLTGGRIRDLTQPGMERLVVLTVDITDELGQSGTRKLILEAMGRRSNLILTDGEDHIIDCLRRVDYEMSPQRQVLPGLYYRLPQSPAGKLPLTDLTEERWDQALQEANPEKRLDDLLLDTLFGLSPLVARELAFRVSGECDVRLFQLGEEGQQRLKKALFGLVNDVKENCFTPIILQRNGKYEDFTYLPISQYGPETANVECENFCTMLDTFFEARERQERARQRGQDLIRLTTNARDRLKRKIGLQEKELADTENRDELRIRGDLITANLYRMERGMSSVCVQNYYDEAGGELTIALDPLLTPQENAAKYYKRYHKAKTAQHYLTEQLAKARSEQTYLESVLEELRQAETEQDFIDIRNELREAGYLRQMKVKKEPKRPASGPREFRSSAGLRILVGRNNRQNDKLTLKEAGRWDLWFHTQKIHGSHVILCTGGVEPDSRSVEEAAMLAAWYSQASAGANVPVDYTQVRHVKKPAGARPGMVIYDPYQTIFVTPDEALVKALRVK